MNILCFKFVHLNNIFYHPHVSRICILNEEESVHAVRVLRLRAGDEIKITDGKGGLFAGKISEANPKKCAVNITAKLSYDSPHSPAHLHLAVAPTKSTDRYEWFLEKATEIGVDEITPLICSRSERKVLNTERLEKVFVAAMKQSLNLYLPLLNPPVRFQEFIAPSVRTGEIKEEKNLQKFIAHLPDTGQAETHLKNHYHKGYNSIILIGPEGDFSREEIMLAEKNGYIEISLGKNRLRTETAAIAACHTICLLNES